MAIHAVENHLFGAIGAVLLVPALVFFIPILITYLETPPVSDFPTLIVYGFVVIAAFQCLFSGLILSIIHAKDLQDFEFRIIDIYKEYGERR
jgi:ethanolamine transporter EutH